MLTAPAPQTQPLASNELLRDFVAMPSRLGQFWKYCDMFLLEGRLQRALNSTAYYRGGRRGTPIPVCFYTSMLSVVFLISPSVFASSYVCSRLTLFQRPSPTPSALARRPVFLMVRAPTEMNYISLRFIPRRATLTQLVVTLLFSR